MNQSEVLSYLIAEAIAPVVRRAVQPETTYLDGGGDVLPRRGAYLGTRSSLHEPKKPLAPRDRLSTRLSLLLALSECRKQLMLDIIRDVEAIADAKAHNTVPGL